jgi:hypothetical protein
MKYLIYLLFLLPLLTFGQFGFERNNEISVIKNNIQQKYAWVGGLDYCQFSNIDLNLDGVQDLYIFDKTCNKSLTFIQNGATGVQDFEYAPEYETIFPKMYGWTLLVDFNGDGKKDIFTSSPGGATVYKNTSTIATGLAFTIETLLLPTVYHFASVDINTFINVGQGDIPSITDIDGDGDKDVLAFYFNNNCIRYYKNLSQELYNNSDSLEFECVNICYGNIMESNTTNQILLDTCCYGDQVANPEDVIFERPVAQGEDRHTGSTVLSLDLDADGMEDLIIGDLAYTSLTRLMNDGTTPNTNVNMVSPDYAFPSYDTPTDVTIFPAAFHVDINNDGERDLLVSPNSTIDANNYRSLWYYKNNNVDNLPDFELQTRGFLQDEMVESGSESYPVYFDHNGDGLMDLIVAIADRFDTISNTGYSTLTYYENTGTASAPEFTFVTDDYMNLSTFNGVSHLFYRPAFGDADGDGDADLLLSDLNDTMYYFENSAGAGSIAQFINPTPFKNNLGQVIYEGIQVSPKFVDLDRDGKQDLVIGKRNGTIAYYRNVGTTGNYSFEFITGTLGGVNVSEFWTTEGTAVPEFIDIDNEYHLICGATNGYLHYYNQIDGNLSGNFTLVDSTLEDIYIGEYSTPAVLDIDGDNRLEMLLGNKRGGLSAFQSAIVTNVGLVGYNGVSQVSVYPNPAQNEFFIDLSNLLVGSYKAVNYTLVDVSGKIIQTGSINQTITPVDISNLSQGVYFLFVDVDGQIANHKIAID